MNKAWLFVIIGGLAETGWTVFMKLSDGYSIILYDLLMIVFMIISMWLLNQGLARQLPTGPAYAVWVGMGAVGATISGILLFNEMLSTTGYLFLGIILVGVIGMNLTKKTP